MRIRHFAVPAAALAFAVSFGIANAETALSVSCSGAPAAASITWTASPMGGIAPVSLLWGNGSTSTSQTTTNTPGTYTMSIQATDASSSVATSTCAATVAQPQAAPSISSFTATPSSITTGGSTTLAWSVSGASTTSIDNGVGAISSTSIVVAPTVNTTYTLTAANPAGTTTAQTTVIVSATTTPPSVQSQIQALLQQIVALQEQLRLLLAGQAGTTTPPVTPPGQVGKAMCVSFNRDLHQGDDGSDVMQLQQVLANDPATGFNVAPTGFFGPLTVRAMQRFQEDNGIASSSSGYVGPLTRGYFERQCGEGLGTGGSENSATPSATSTEDGVFIPANGNGQGGSHGESHGHDN